MDRREFLAGVIAGTTVVGSGVLSAVGTPAHAAELTGQYGVRDPRILYVCPTAPFAENLRREMGNPDHTQFVGVGAMLCGTRYDFIIIDPATHSYYADQESETLYARYRDWMNQIRCRLTPGPNWRMGTVQYVVQEFDFGTKVGFGIDFAGYRQAVRVHERLEDLTPQHYINSHAVLYEWMARKLRYV